ncbi:zinc-dependent metalloprotease [Phytoactinopolyspora halotolerans]|uniref:Zinc-dependent metalloprotease n=1 Tax=Phytoactinopolyspora halotolerans TaxID=1981512 RepID=A0A6L9S5N8_9ACTN|nr:zinc-dependent metalloprotease [Phytoactinopolyspora halotolerans]NED99389.1 zinc-dependent metalloprotease [Phytoactinopolyspora halotolerans]
MTTNDAAGQLVDWDLAAKTATRLAGSGPVVTEDEAHQTVADLREFAAEAEGHVRAVTGLDGSSASAPLAVVDREGWIRANTDSLRTVVAPLIAKVQKAREGKEGGPLDFIGPKATGLETGVFLAFIAGRVLGQFDPFWAGEPGQSAQPEPAGDDADVSPARGARDASQTSDVGPIVVSGAGSAVVPSAQSLGRLLLVAPNIVHVERELQVEPRDFRLWVCLHEETHRVQFTAVPWLREHLQDEIRSFVSASQLDSKALVANLREVVEALVRAVRGQRDTTSLLDLLQTPEQKAVVQRVTALMSLLEGHADVVMDRVGPEVVPSVETIRRRFQRRRKGSGVDRGVRKVLGFEAKMRQYRDGAKFVNAVIDRVGMEGFNRIWESPQTLPSSAEIADPDAWVKRVHGM